MRTLAQHLAQYAAYHQNRRNVLLHMVGIPLIVLGVAVLASRPVVMPSPAMLLAAALVLFYLRLDLRFGAALAVLLALAVWAGHAVAAEPGRIWLVSGLGLFVAGWVVQFIGHGVEGRKPAFTDDLTGLAIGPLFIVAELAVSAGLRPELRGALHGPAEVNAAAPSMRA